MKYRFKVDVSNLFKDTKIDPNLEIPDFSKSSKSKVVDNFKFEFKIVNNYNEEEKNKVIVVLKKIEEELKNK